MVSIDTAQKMKFSIKDFLRPATLLKKRLAHVFSKDTFSYRTPLVAASDEIQKVFFWVMENDRVCYSLINPRKNTSNKCTSEKHTYDVQMYEL